MKKTLAFFTLLLGCVAMFAQSGPTFPYQAVVRNSQNQLIKDSTFAIGVEVYQGADLKFSETQSATTNANGQFTMNIGGGAEVSGSLSDIADWSVAKFKITYHLSGGDVVSEQLVHPVPYALQAASATGGNFLTSDSAVITTMQNDIAALNAMNAKIDSLAHIVDSLSSLPHGNTPAATFTCGTDSIKDFDNNWYHTVKIGEQCWMKENLRTTSYANGTGIEFSSNTSTETAYRYYPNGQESYVSTYGYLYNWKAVMDTSSSSDANPSGVQGVCPEGWHVPSDAEFQTLMDYCSDHYAAGDDRANNAMALADTTNWYSSSYSNAIGNNLSANNQSGFSALPAGNYGGSYYGFGSYAYFWSSTPNGEYNAYYMTLYTDRSDARLESFSRRNGRSVRCLRDAGVGGTPGSNETAGTTPSAPATMSCEQVMECMGDTLGKLNTKIEEQGTEIETLNGTVTSQGQTIETLNSTVESQGNTIDSLAHIVDSLSSLPHGGGTTPSAPGGDNACCSELGARLDSLEHVISSQDSTINALNEQVEDLLPFECGKSKLKDAEGNEYNTVKIGNQCWMKENLRTTTNRNNVGNIYTNNRTDGYNAETYGYYYDWAAVMQDESGEKVRGICPEGWHVPSEAEWDTLTTYVKLQPEYVCDACSGSDYAWYTYCIAKALSQPTGWSSSNSDGCNAGNTGDKANATGFSAVPAGEYTSGHFVSFGDYAYFWSANQGTTATEAMLRVLYKDADYVRRNYSNKVYGHSVRCLRD